MAIPAEDLKKFVEALESATRPLFFFDDDPDGLSSFLLLYRLVKDGKGVCVKSAPVLKEEFLKTVNEYSPDLVVILDMPDVTQDFLDGVSCKTIWLDHHEPQDRKGVFYINPRKEDDKNNKPTSYWCWEMVKEKRPEDLWIAMAGCVGDWFLPQFTEDFRSKYPKLLTGDVKVAPDALFNEPIGKITRVFSFLLKGKTSEMMKSIKILTRIEDPLEILEQTSAQGGFIWKRFMSVNKEYEETLALAKECVTDDFFLLFRYTEKRMSFTSDLSNELLYTYPDKITLICRNKSGQMKCSVRSSKDALPGRIKEALQGLEGYGGGHEHACGFVVREDQFEEFLSRFKETFN